MHTLGSKPFWICIGMLFRADEWIQDSAIFFPLSQNMTAYCAINKQSARMFWLNHISTSLCHVIYYHSNRKYTCLVGLGLIEANMDLSRIHLSIFGISIYQRKKTEIQMQFQKNLNPLWCGFRICRLQQFLFIESVHTVFIGLLCPIRQSGVINRFKVYNFISPSQ